MKLNFSKIILFFVLFLFTFFSSCSLGDPNNKPIVITDPPRYNYLTFWKESEVRKGGAKWEPIASADTLFLYSDFRDTIIPRNGEYIYNSSKLKINVERAGSFIQNDSLMLFLSNPKLTDTTAITYNFSGDSLLILTNKNVVPSIGVKYKKEAKVE